MTPRRFALLITAATLLVQAAWILCVPPYYGIDEIDHAYRAAAVARGEWMPGGYAEDGRGRLVTVPDDIVAAARPQCRSLDYLLPENCAAVEQLPGGMERVASGAATYSPVYYWVVGVPSLPFEGTTALYLMRTTAALLCALMIGAAAWCFAQGGLRAWRLTGFLLALVPVALYSTVLPAANGLEIAAGLTLWCALLSLRDRLPPGTETVVLLVAGIAGFLLAGLRALGPGFLVVIAGFCLLLGGRAMAGTLLRRRLLVGLMAVAVVAALVARLWWNQHVDNAVGADNSGPNGEWVSSAPILWQLQTIAAFPFRDDPGPAFVYPLFAVFFLVLIVCALRYAGTRDRRVLLLLVIGVLAMPAVLTGLTYDGRGMIWQGRYGLALAFGVPLVAAVVLDRWRPRFRGPFLFAAIGAWVLIELGCVLQLRDTQLARIADNDDPMSVPGALPITAAVLAAGLLLLRIALADRGSSAVSEEAPDR